LYVNSTLYQWLVFREVFDMRREVVGPLQFLGFGDDGEACNKSEKSGREGKQMLEKEHGE